MIASAQVAEELRVASREGVLRLDALLWHAWISLRVTATALEDAAADLQETEFEPPSTRKERKNQRQRDTDRAQQDRARRRNLKELESNNGSDSSDRSRRCPHDACSRSQRPFRSLEAVFKHL